METFTQRRVPVAQTGVTKPAGAASSVFDVPQPPKKKRAPRTEFDVDSVEIRKNVPPPPLVAGPRVSKYKVLLQKMKVGDSVVVPKRVAHGLKSAAKKAGINVTLRTVDAENVGVWKQ